MLKEHLKHIRCPASGDRLTCNATILEGDHIIEGSLKTQSGNEYQIKNGVPDFRFSEVNKDQKRSELSFGTEWKLFNREGWDEREKHERNHFFNYTRLTPSMLTNKIVFDVGCGNGRYINIIQKQNPKLIIGLDVSEASYVAFENTKHMKNVLILRGNLMKSPVVEKYFDIVYSIGVLHHTPSAMDSFNSLAKFCKINSVFSVYLYGRGNPILYTVNNILRNRVFSKLPLIFTKIFSIVLSTIMFFILRIPYLGSFISSLLNKFIYLGGYHNMFDAYSAGYTSFHSPEEVESWYHQNGFSCHIDVRQNRTALYCSGIKVSKNPVNETKRYKVSPFKEFLYSLFLNN